MVSKRVCDLALFAVSLLLALYSGISSLPLGGNLSSQKNFDSFFASGRAAASGQDPYGAYDLTLRGHWEGRSFDAVNLNPPIALPLFQILSRQDMESAYQIWYALSLAAYVIMLCLLLRAYPSQATPPRVTWALALAGLWYSLWDGQIYMLIVAGSTGAWLLLRGNHKVPAGILIGLTVALKPQFLVWPTLLALGGHWTVAGVAILSAGLVSLLPALVYGSSVYVAWLRVLPSASWIAQPDNASLPGLGARFGIEWVATFAAALLLLALAIWAWRRRPSPLRISELALVAALLASPIAWVGYTLALLPLFLSRPAWTHPLAGAAMLLLFPNWLVWELSPRSMEHLMVFGSVYNLALLLALLGLVIGAPGSGTATSRGLLASRRP
ncbi:MAG: glycosyltransferase family 87 protein [Chloroflexota bacterium]